MKCCIVLTTALLCVTVASSQLVTPTMMCEMTCIEKKIGKSSAPWDSPAAQDCRKECIQKLLEMIPPDLRQDLKALNGQEEPNQE